MTDSQWVVIEDTGTELTHTITELTNGTAYDVQVRAKNFQRNRTLVGYRHCHAA